MAYVIIGGVLLISLLAPLFIGGDAWVVPVAVLPFALMYGLYDRELLRRERAGEGGH